MPGTFNTLTDGQTTDDLSPQWSASLDATAPGISAVITQQQAPGESWYDSLARALPIVATTVQQGQILQVQMDRAKQGLPPLDASQFGIGVNANVGLSADTKQLLTYAGIGVAIMFLMHHSKR